MFAVQNDGPTWWEYVMLGVDIVGFEVQSSEYRRDCECLPVRKTDQRG
jgi:hypothetical protein